MQNLNPEQSHVRRWCGWVVEKLDSQRWEIVGLNLTLDDTPLQLCHSLLVYMSYKFLGSISAPFSFLLPCVIYILPPPPPPNHLKQKRVINEIDMKVLLKLLQNERNETGALQALTPPTHPTPSCCLPPPPSCSQTYLSQVCDSKDPMAMAKHWHSINL